jgi:hypothetical protein
MFKRVGSQCAFATCDQQERNLRSVRQPAAIVTDAGVAPVARSVSRMPQPSASYSLAGTAAGIDHPPRLLSV